jgi:hypothetical protein
MSLEEYYSYLTNSRGPLNELIGKTASGVNNNNNNNNGNTASSTTEDLKARLDKTNQELADEKKRHELYKLIPTNHPVFKDKVTGKFDEQKYKDAVERRLRGNMTMADIAYMYDVSLPSNSA